MRRIISVLFFCSICAGANAQTFTFECFGGYLTAADANCDICNTQVQSRLFNGLLVRRSGVVTAWIDCPYIIRAQGNNLVFQEIIPNPQSITVALAGTGYTTLAGFKDSTACMCARQDSSWIGGGGGDPSITNEGILGVSAGASNTSVITSNTSTAVGVTITAAGINTISETTSSNGGNITITGTEVDGSITNEGDLTVGAGGANTSTIVSNTSGSTPVTVSGSTTILVTESGSTITLQADTSLLATVNDMTREPAYQVVYGTGSGVDSENWFQTDPTDDNIKLGWPANTADTGIVNIAPPSGYSNNKAMFYARDAVNLLKYKRGTMPAWWIQQKAGSNGDGTTNNVLSIDYNQYGGVSEETSADAQFGISMEPHWVTSEGDTVSEFHLYFNDMNGANNRPITGFFDYWNHRESYVSVQIDNVNFPGHLGNLHTKVNINRTNGSTALYPLEVYKHKKTLTTTNASFTRAELDSATVFVLGNYNTGGESPQIGLSTLMRWTNTQDRRATFYMGLIDIDGSGFDGSADFIGYHQNSGVFRESFRIADNTGYFGIGLRSGNRPLQLLDVNGTSLHRGSGRFNAPGDSSVLHLKSAGGATAKMMDLANTAGDVNVFVSAATPEGATTGSPGDFDLSTAGAAYLKVSGSATNTGWEQLATGIASNTIKTYYLTRTLQAANNTIELGVFNHTGGGAGYAELFAVVNNGAGNSISKKYRIPFYFGNTGGAWQNLLPVANTGAYSGNDFKLEIKSSSTRDTVRVRTVSGATGGTLLVSIVVTPYQGSSSTFTETTTTWTAPTAVTATYFANTLSEERQKAGVNTLNPTATFQITGLGATSSTESFRAQNSSGTRMFTIRDDNRTSIGNNGSPARTLDVTGEVRISDLTTDTPTRIVGADADGDLDDITVSTGLTLSGGNLTADDASATNELQTLASTSDATSHTVTLSTSGGSIQFVEGTGIGLATTGTGLDGILTITNTATGDGSVTNEGILGVSAGGSNDALLISNTSTAVGVTYAGSAGVVITESTSSNGGTITIAMPSGSTNQTLRYTGSAWAASSEIINDDAAVGIGGNPVSGFELYVNGASRNDGAIVTRGTGSNFISALTTPHVRIWNTTATTGDTWYLGSEDDGDFSITSGNLGAIEMIIGNTTGYVGLGSVTPTQKLHVTGNARVTGAYYDSNNDPGTSGQVLSSTVTGTDWISGGGGTLTAANNGLYVSGTTVRMGTNPLIEATLIDQDANDMRFYDGKWSYTSWSTSWTPTQGFGIQGTENNPTTGSTPTQDGIAEFRAVSSGGSLQPNSLTIGGHTTDANGMWAQVRSGSVPNVYYPFALQPNGGNFSVGRASAALAKATFSAVALSGSTASGSVVHWENTEGNAKAAATFGVGTDVTDGEIAYFDGADAVRVTNRNTTTGTSSFRIAVGGETSDRVTVIASSVTPSARMGVGITAPLSTLQSAGSLAASCITFTGALTLDERHYRVEYTGTAAITITLPTAANAANRMYVIHHRGTAGTITLSIAINKGNGATFNTLTAGQHVFIHSDGTTWNGIKLNSL